MTHYTPRTAPPKPMAKPDPLPWWAWWSGTHKVNLLVYRNSLCADCRIDVRHINECYMVHNHVWADAGACRYIRLCIGCLEQRLGRTLASADFTDAPDNRLDEWHVPGFGKRLIRRSARLNERLART